MSSDTTLITVAINAFLDVIWPILPTHILEQLAYA